MTKMSDASCVKIAIGFVCNNKRGGASSELAELQIRIRRLLLESFVVSELLKLASWPGRRLTFSHYRTKDQDEVDIVIEDRRGRVVGIEVKASATVKSDDFRGLRQLEQAVGDRFVRGLVYMAMIV